MTCPPRNKRFHFTPIVGQVKGHRILKFGRIKKCPWYLKAEGHKLLDKIFGDDKIAAYEWMYYHSYTGHFSTMSEPDARQVIELLKIKLKNLNK